MEQDIYARALARIDEGENACMVPADVANLLRALLVERQEIEELYSERLPDAETQANTDAALREFAEGE